MSTINQISDHLGKVTNIATDPIGAIMPFGGGSVPTGWLLCDDSAVSRTTYSELFAVIGTTYGAGDGSTTFNVPDMRASSPVGAGTSTKFTQNETLTLGSYEDDQAQGHGHVILQENAFNAGLALQAANGTTDGVSGRTMPTSANLTSNGNGTPRTGNVTKGKQTVVNYIIKAL